MGIITLALHAYLYDSFSTDLICLKSCCTIVDDIHVYKLANTVVFGGTGESDHYITATNEDSSCICELHAMSIDRRLQHLFGGGRHSYGQRECCGIRAAGTMNAQYYIALS
jgi:hypothetical protein